MGQRVYEIVTVGSSVRDTDSDSAFGEGESSSWVAGVRHHEGATLTML
jgi:hypothetical protein